MRFPAPYCRKGVVLVLAFILNASCAANTQHADSDTWLEIAREPIEVFIDDDHDAESFVGGFFEKVDAGLRWLWYGTTDPGFTMKDLSHLSPETICKKKGHQWRTNPSTGVPACIDTDTHGDYEETEGRFVDLAALVRSDLLTTDPVFKALKKRVDWKDPVTPVVELKHPSTPQASLPGVMVPVSDLERFAFGVTHYGRCWGGMTFFNYGKNPSDVLTYNGFKKAFAECDLLKHASEEDMRKAFRALHTGKNKSEGLKFVVFKAEMDKLKAWRVKPYAEQLRTS